MSSFVTEISREEAEQEVHDLGWWYQDFELPSGVRTGTGQEPSYRPAERWALIEPHIPEDLSGKTVLDVGGNAGYFSIQMKLRGAERCVLVEPYREFAAQAAFAAGEFGVELEVVNEDVHTYCLTTEERFDYVLFLGLFYHLKYPVLVLDRLAEMTKDRIVFHSYSGEAGGGSTPGLERDLDRVDDALLIGISTPYSKRGALWTNFQAHYAQNASSSTVRVGMPDLHVLIHKEQP